MFGDRAPAFLGKRARDVFLENRHIFLQKFEELKKRGIATDIKLFGSIVSGEDGDRSDIDFLVFVHEANLHVFSEVESVLCKWIHFPVHITLKDDKNYVPELILETAVSL